MKLLEAETARSIFLDNIALCNEVTERVVQHFVRSIETHCRHMQYLKFLQTIVKSEGNYIRKCQEMVMTEVTYVHGLTHRLCLQSCDVHFHKHNFFFSTVGVLKTSLIALKSSVSKNTWITCIISH